MSLFDKVGAFLKREADDVGDIAARARDRLDQELTEREAELKMTPEEKLRAIQRKSSETDAKMERIADKVAQRSATRLDDLAPAQQAPAPQVRAAAVPELDDGPEHVKRGGEPNPAPTYAEPVFPDTADAPESGMAEGGLDWVAPRAGEAAVVPAFQGRTSPSGSPSAASAQPPTDPAETLQSDAASVQARAADIRARVVAAQAESVTPNDPAQVQPTPPHPQALAPAQSQPAQSQHQPQAPAPSEPHQATPAAQVEAMPAGQSLSSQAPGHPEQARPRPRATSLSEVMARAPIPSNAPEPAPGSTGSLRPSIDQAASRAEAVSGSRSSSRLSSESEAQSGSVHAPVSGAAHNPAAHNPAVDETQPAATATSRVAPPSRPPQAHDTMSASQQEPPAAAPSPAPAHEHQGHQPTRRVGTDKTMAQLRYEEARAAADSLLDELRSELRSEGEI